MATLSCSHSCGDGDTALAGIAGGTRHAQGRCGYGPRLPLLVVSPWARRNFVDHTITDQTSIIRFVEDNWHNGKRESGRACCSTRSPIRSTTCSISTVAGQSGVRRG